MKFAKQILYLKFGLTEENRLLASVNPLFKDKQKYKRISREEDLP